MKVKDEGRHEESLKGELAHHEGEAESLEMQKMPQKCQVHFFLRCKKKQGHELIWKVKQSLWKCKKMPQKLGVIILFIILGIVNLRPVGSNIQPQGLSGRVQRGSFLDKNWHFSHTIVISFLSCYFIVSLFLKIFFRVRIRIFT